ncbi:pleckstrin-2 isoform X1 [Elephas maximus indicus]|uniref:pleckstrin-2 isoform X1 n=1 Tax=Elephas maximus indicus TaxID=99487 RepID=UPI002116F8C6|nr:pleckstrin-2 isoform X1 [Elephas maximus indicus]
MEDSEGGVLKEGFLVKRVSARPARASVDTGWSLTSPEWGQTRGIRRPPFPFLARVGRIGLPGVGWAEQRGARRLKVGMEAQGHIVHNWKVRWFILRQNTLLYYKLEGGRRVTPPKGRILLDGCTIICPCLDYENRPLLIKLKTQTSAEYFLEACSREERDAWAFEITGAIHAGQPGKVQQLHVLKNSFKLPPHISLHRIVDKMRDSSSGIRPSPNMEQGSTYKKTFIGSSLVDWLISNSFAASRLEAVTLASMLLEENFLRPVGTRSMGAIRSGDLAEQFLDDSTALYTFAESYKKKINSKEEISLSTMDLSGTVIKQGYLAKQGHKRKNWKVRRFVLRRDPAFLHYYDPSKEDNKPVSGFSLRGSLVSALEDNGVPTGVKGNVQGNLFKVITKDDTHYYIQASSKAERAEWIEAIKQLT